MAIAQPILVLGQGRLLPQFCQPTRAVLERFFAHETVVATRREMFPERHLETEGGGGGLMWYLPEIPTSHLLECEWVSRVNSRAV